MESLIIKDCLDEERLLSVLKLFFGKQQLTVAYLNMYIDQHEDIFLELNDIHGNFYKELCIYSKKSLKVDEIATFICLSFDTLVLISSKDINPYSWILVNKSGMKSVVYQTPNDTGFFIKTI